MYQQSNKYGIDCSHYLNLMNIWNGKRYEKKTNNCKIKMLDLLKI